MRELMRTTHFAVTLDDEARVLRRTRSAAPFTSLEEVRGAYDAMVLVMDGIDRARYAQLIDTRDAPPRNDPEFEALVVSYHAALYGGFRLSAVLVQSAVGKLHVNRMLGASGVEARVFVDEAAALAWLSGDGEAKPTTTF